MRLRKRMQLLNKVANQDSNNHFLGFTNFNLGTMSVQEQGDFMNAVSKYTYSLMPVMMHENPEHRENIVTEVKTDLWKNLGGVDGKSKYDNSKGKFLTYLTDIILNAISTEKRRMAAKKRNLDMVSIDKKINDESGEGTEVQILQHDDRVDEQVIMREKMEAYREALKVLRPKTREMFVMHHEKQFSIKEVAEHFQVSVQAVNQALSRAMPIIAAETKRIYNSYKSN